MCMRGKDLQLGFRTDPILFHILVTLLFVVYLNLKYDSNFSIVKKKLISGCKVT